MHNDRFVCAASALEHMKLVDEAPERIAAHMAEQGRQRRKVTDRML